MKLARTIASAALLATRARCEVIWDGRFNDMSSSADLEKWSWSNLVGSYQYYIHGSGKVSEYVNLSPEFKNPADKSSKQGAKISLTSTSFWNGQKMRRTELIPQTKAAIAKGKVYYHFSMKRSDVNPPSTAKEHQIAFFESHFVEMKSGWQSGATGTDDPLLRWSVDSKTQWSVNWEANIWHNVAYEIDFSAGTVGFWYSTGGAALTQKVAPVKAAASSNGADWHLGVLELPRDGYPDKNEDFYFSGVFIETGPITTAIGGAGGSAGSAGGSDTPASGNSTSPPSDTGSGKPSPSDENTKPATSPAPGDTGSGKSTPSDNNSKPATSPAPSPNEKPPGGEDKPKTGGEQPKPNPEKKPCRRRRRRSN